MLATGLHLVIFICQCFVWSIARCKETYNRKGVICAMTLHKQSHPPIPHPHTHTYTSTLQPPPPQPPNTHTYTSSHRSLLVSVQTTQSGSRDIWAMSVWLLSLSEQCIPLPKYFIGVHRGVTAIYFSFINTLGAERVGQKHRHIGLNRRKYVACVKCSTTSALLLWKWNSACFAGPVEPWLWPQHGRNWCRLAVVV